MESPGRNLICAPANILSFWLFFATAVYHSVNSRCLCQLICSRFPEWNRLTIRWLMSTQSVGSLVLWATCLFCFCWKLYIHCFFPSLFFHITLISYRLLLKPLRATPWRCLSSLTSHLILSRPIRSVLICSLNHNHHTNTHTCVHTHTVPLAITPHPCQPQTPGLFEEVSVNDSSPLLLLCKAKGAAL